MRGALEATRWLISDELIHGAREHLFCPRVGIARSMRIFEDLQRHGVAVVPRIGWVIEPDVRRFARWFIDHPTVEMAGLDLQTYRTQRDWSSQLEGLLLFDTLTRRHLVYLVNGPSILERWIDLLALISPRRLRLTNTALASPPPDWVEEQLALVDGRRAGREFVLACESRRVHLKRAEEAAAHRRRGRRVAMS